MTRHGLTDIDMFVQLVLEEADRSLHDALCVVRSLVKKRFLIGGGGAAETEVSLVNAILSGLFAIHGRDVPSQVHDSWSDVCRGWCLSAGEL